MRRTVVRSRSSDQRSAGASDDVSQVYRHVCKVEYSHAVDRGVLHQLQAGVLRIDIDACTVHELQVFKGFFSRLPRLQQLCVARGQVALKTEPAVSSRPNSAYGTSTTVRIRQNRINAVKKATQGILHLVGKLLKTPRHCRLVSLALPGLHLTEATIVHFEEAFKACSTLRELDFREQDLSRPSTAERMFRAITASSTVQAVCLRGCKIGPRSARYLGHVLRANNERRDQLIWKGELRGEAVSKKAIRLQGLVVLDVSQNELGSEGMSELLDVLENDRWMAALNLAANGDMAESTIHEHWDRCFKINRASFLCILLFRFFGLESCLDFFDGLLTVVNRRCGRYTFGDAL